MLILLFLAAKPSFFENRPMIPLPIHEPSSSFWPCTRPRPTLAARRRRECGSRASRRARARAARCGGERAAGGAAAARWPPVRACAAAPGAWRVPAMRRPVRSARPGPRTGALARAIQRGGAVLCHPVVGRAVERGPRDWCVGTWRPERCVRSSCNRSDPKRDRRRAETGHAERSRLCGMSWCGLCDRLDACSRCASNLAAACTPLLLRERLATLKSWQSGPVERRTLIPR